ncbi:DUF7257 domain-containing protein [Mycobacterium palustre]|uniref:DUF7257 domain-containing protein n=1 Tax=Mycobacterium palustre TaxID=153971 RepID=A0A1X1ZL29_9MYCO|nr:hypothetical protein [Mycobacterium palustre]ORW24008.1 hypothetical protein AWC19_00175 [Mycobacterium palustre]
MTQTPNYPGLHNPALFGPVGAVPDAQQWILTISALTEYFIGEIAIAFGGISILGWQPFAFLQTWGENLVNQAQEAFDGQQTANANLATLLDGIMGTGHTFSDLASFLSAAASLASTVNSEFSALLSGLGAGNVTGLVSYLSAAAGNATSAAEAWAEAVEAAGAADAAALGSAVSGAATNAGNALTQVGEIVSNSLQADAAAVGSALAGAAANASNAVGQIEDTVNNAINGAATAATSLGSAVSGFISGLWSAWTGSSGQASAAAAAAAAASQAATNAQNASNIGGMTGLSVASLNQALQRSAIGSGSGTGGLYQRVDFTTYANQSTLSGIFTQSTAALSSSGTNNPLGLNNGSTRVTQFGITSGAVAWQNVSTHGYDLEHYPTPTTTDYQVISAQFNSVWSEGPTVLIGRSNSAMGTCVMAYMSAIHNANDINTGIQLIVLGCFVSGAWTQLASVTSSINGTGLFELVLGDRNTSNPYSISVLFNGTTLISYADSSHISQVGSSYRYGGLGGVAYTTPRYSYDVSPLTISSWGIADNAPPTVIGSGFRAYRATTSSVTLTGGAVFPSNTFDTVQWNTPDLTWSGGKLTFSVPGWYLVTMKNAPTSPGGTFSWQQALYVNGTLSRMGQGNFYVAGAGDANCQAAWIIYAAAGDYIQPGWYGASLNQAGDASGLNCSFEVALLNCGTLS